MTLHIVFTDVGDQQDWLGGHEPVGLQNSSLALIPIAGPDRPLVAQEFLHPLQNGQSLLGIGVAAPRSPRSLVNSALRNDQIGEYEFSLHRRNV